jgi:hypothetical protein
MYDEKIKTKDLLHGLSYHRKVLSNLLNQGKGYNEFLKSLLSYNALFNDGKVVHVKDIAVEFKISPAKIRIYLEEIHDDILLHLQSIERPPIKCGIPVCSISIKDMLYRCIYLENIQLNMIPREGETIEISFLRPYYNWTYFHVYQVTHQIDYDEHRIHIELLQWVNRFARFKEDEIDYNQNRKYYDDKMNWYPPKRYSMFEKGEWK